MPYTLFNLQLFGDEGGDTGTGAVTGEAVNVSDVGVATTEGTEQIATATGNDGDTWESLIKGKYKDQYNQAVKDAIGKRFKNQRDLQGQIDMINPMIQQLAARYNVKLNADGSIPVDALTNAVMDDNSMYEQEAFDRGMSVNDLKHLKSVERENEQLKARNQRDAQAQEWGKIVEQGNRVKEMYPTFNLDQEMDNPQFAKLLATFQKSGFPDAVRTAYESVHRDEIMGGAMQYGVQKAQEKLSNAVQANLSRPSENGTSNVSPAHIGQMDPSKLTKSQIDDLKRRAERGERITFA